jgi:formate dehydrogenase accessory protein FdhE
MPAAASSRSRADDRIARAKALAAAYPAANEALAFYGAVVEYQSRLGGEGVAVQPGQPNREHERRPVIGAIDRGAVLDAIPDFLDWLPRTAPGGLAEAARDLRAVDRPAWGALVDSYLSGEDDDSEPADPAVTFVVEAVIQPFAEQVAVRLRPPDHGRWSPARWKSAGSTPESQAMLRCPLCATPPVAGVLREEGHGAKRSLVCALCLTEWECRRVVCTVCGEQEFDALPVFTSDRFAHVRIEACERCRHYVKTVDLTNDGLAIPCVDDIASVSLDLWARAQGYSRVKRNLLGL